MKRFKKRFSATTATLLLLLGTTSIAAPSASAASGTITGTVDCFYGNNNVSGVWVDATNGQDGWATLSGSGASKSYRYTLSQTSTYKLRVGCGGTPANWGATMHSPLVNGQNYNWVCSYSISYGFFCATS